MFYQLYKNPILLIKQLIYLFFIYMILEGVLRKWLFPNYSFQIYLLKDFFLIIIYILSFKYKLLWKSKFSKFFTAFAVLITVPSFFIYELNNIGVLSFLLGIKSYWFFMPLAFILAHTFTYNDVISFCKKNLYFIVPYFFLVISQSYSSPESIINSGYFSIVNNPERPSAFFTYTTQNTFYFVFLLCCYYVWFLHKKNLTKKNIVTIIFLIFSLCSILVLLKSRAVYIYSFFISFASCFFIFNLSDKKIKIKKLLIIMIITPIIFFGVSKLFIIQFNFSKERINTDAGKDLAITKYLEKSGHSVSANLCINHSSLCRIIDDIYFVAYIPTYSYQAKGIGAGTHLVAHFTQNQKLFLGENENQRIMNELGQLVGTFFVTSKYIFIFLFSIFFLRKNKHVEILIPILAFVLVITLIGPITYSTSFISFIFWICLALLFSSFKDKT